LLDLAGALFPPTPAGRAAPLLGQARVEEIDVESRAQIDTVADAESRRPTWTFIDLAPPAGCDRQADVERLLAPGMTHLDIGQGDVDRVVMADPDGNEFCLLSAR
jgi:hypothetical protein